jgi:hypothetical protein
VQASEGDADNVYASGRKSEIELLSRDILHIEPIRDDLQPRSGPLPKRPVFWACLALPALVWVGSGQLAQRRRRLLSDPARLKARRALSRAEATLRGDDAIEQRVAGAVRGFIADKLDRAEAGLSEADLREGLMQRKVDATVVDSALQLLARCDAARYAPGATPAEEWTREAKQVLSQLESGLRDED